MRQSQRAPKDVSHIEMDDKSMHKTAEAAAQGAAAESKLQEARKVELKLHTRRKAAHVSINLATLPYMLVMCASDAQTRRRVPAQLID